ncbi:bacillithiol transferase BstA [Paenibacillus sp. P26]|nr:bacillithiol transferase BstA [Paenibacillus sp. P26]
MMKSEYALRFPIGEFDNPEEFDPGEVEAWIHEIARSPERLRAAVSGLNARQWDTPYRPGGWTARQVVHHLADSHMNSFIRFKLALTEREPVIKPYDEAAWAQLPDTANADPELSLALLDALHARWSLLLRGLTTEEWHRSFVHPERGLVRLYENTAMYAWHGNHHLAHIGLIKST